MVGSFSDEKIISKSKQLTDVTQYVTLGIITSI